MAEKIQKSDRLLKLTVLAPEERTLVAGIAEYYEPEKIIGQQVCILVNLEPRKIRGILSQGMILMAEEADGTLKFTQPSEKISNGCIVR